MVVVGHPNYKSFLESAIGKLILVVIVVLAASFSFCYLVKNRIRGGCSIRTPQTVNLSAIEAYPHSSQDSDYIEVHPPKNLCLLSYPPGVDGYYIVQFKGPVRDEYRDQVQSLGGAIYDYLAEHAYIVKMSKNTKDRVQNLETVRWLGIYQPAYKIQPFVKWLSADPPAREVTIPLLNRTGEVTLIVSFFEGEAVKDLTGSMEAFGGRILAIPEHTNTIQVLIDASRVPDIANTIGVKAIEELPLPKLIRQL